MNLEVAVNLLLMTGIVLANIPWLLSNRLFFMISFANKSVFVGLGEWLVYYFLTGGVAYLLEQKTMGHVMAQTWEFYAITLFMFAIFAFPGFIYRYNLKTFLTKKSVPSSGSSL